MIEQLGKIIEITHELFALIRDVAASIRGTIKEHLLRRAETVARSAPTASTVRIGTVPLRFYERGAAQELQRAGRGVIRGDCFEAPVSTMHPGVTLAAHLRTLHAPCRFHPLEID